MFNTLVSLSLILHTGYKDRHCQDFLVVHVLNLFIFKVFFIDNDKLWCEKLGKGFRHSKSRKIQGVQEIVIGPVGQFQSVTNR